MAAAHSISTLTPRYALPPARSGLATGPAWCPACHGCNHVRFPRSRSATILLVTRAGRSMLSARRRRRLAVLTACRAGDTRLAVAQDARRGDSRPTTIRNPENVGENACGDTTPQPREFHPARCPLRQVMPVKSPNWMAPHVVPDRVTGLEELRCVCEIFASSRDRCVFSVELHPAYSYGGNSI
jgi:hypothetical protein